MVPFPSRGRDKKWRWGECEIQKSQMSRLAEFGFRGKQEKRLSVEACSGNPPRKYGRYGVTRAYNGGYIYGLDNDIGKIW